MLSGHNMTFQNTINCLFVVGYGFKKNASYAQSKYIHESLKGKSKFS